MQSTHSVDPPIIIQTVPVLTQHRNGTNECYSIQLLVASLAAPLKERRTLTGQVAAHGSDTLL